MYTIERRGHVIIRPDGGAKRCGEIDTAWYNYHVRADVHELCPEGWVLDNREIPRIVESVAAHQPVSCEALCDAICQALLVVIGGRVKGILVEVEGIPGSWIRSCCGDIVA